MIIIYSLYYFTTNLFFLGPPSVPVLGHSLVTLRMSPEFLINKGLEFFENYGNVIGAYLGTKVIVFLIDPQDVEIILGSSVHLEKAKDYE